MVTSIALAAFEERKKLRGNVLMLNRLDFHFNNNDVKDVLGRKLFVKHLIRTQRETFGNK